MTSAWLRNLTCYRSRKYLEWVRSRACCVTGSYCNVVAHHVRMYGSGGTGIKPSDYMAVPLSTEAHATLHRIGESEFWKDEDPRDIIISLMATWIAEKGDKC